MTSLTCRLMSEVNPQRVLVLCYTLPVLYRARFSYVFVYREAW